MYRCLIGCRWWLHARFRCVKNLWKARKKDVPLENSWGLAPLPEEEWKLVHYLSNSCYFQLTCAVAKKWIRSVATMRTNHEECEAIKTQLALFSSFILLPFWYCLLCPPQATETRPLSRYRCSSNPLDYGQTRRNELFYSHLVTYRHVVSLELLF